MASHLGSRQVLAGTAPVLARSCHSAVASPITVTARAVYCPVLSRLAGQSRFAIVSMGAIDSIRAIRRTGSVSPACRVGGGSDRHVPHAIRGIGPIHGILDAIHN